MTDDRTAANYSRRTFLLGAGSAALAACSSTNDAAPSGGGDTTAGSVATTNSTAGSTSAAGSPASGSSVSSNTVFGNTVDPISTATFDAVAVCALTAASTTGPFPSKALLDRRDIHEGYPGHPLRLGLRVVDQACQPISGAVVDIWHADASGDYSSYADNGSGKDEGDGSTFCRGAQTTDANGIAEFQTIYPGWYEGRAVHIHVTVRVDGEPVRTAQLYFDEAYTESLMTEGEYAQFGQPDTPWGDDGLIGDPGSDGTGLVLTQAATSLGPGTLGLLNLGV